MTRRQVREHTFKALFQKEFCDHEEYRERCELYVGELEELPEDGKREIKERALLVESHLEELDEKLDVVAEGWKTRRMGKVELTVLRLAAYEILFDEQVPAKVAINEAVELAKIYGGEDSPGFINAILGKLVKGLDEVDETDRKCL
ncbi:transcription antitermination factor NusB [Hominifimenecus sp. rT4P-3]|uniref:transcription antitermination factor NusB n=1 Tax=Hominifimenecus sp. rT4P-3 TaxID=3242979 RepID=UPI003DA1E8D6